LGFSYEIYNPYLDEYVKFEDRPRRIVSLNPAVTETLFLLGFGDKVIATDAFSYRPEEARRLPKIGSYTHVKWEMLQELRPDLIFTTTGAQKDLTKQLMSRGYKVYPVPVPVTVHDIITGVVTVSAVVGEFEKGKDLELSLVKRLSELTGRAKKRRVYVEFDLGGPITIGFPTHVSDALRLLGANNVFDDKPTAYFSPEDDEVKRRDPEIVILEPKRLVQHEVERLKDSLTKRGLGDLLSRASFTVGDFLAHTGPSFITEAMPWLLNVLSS
jgi:iron complex transport system substrate-binding protein